MIPGSGDKGLIALVWNDGEEVHFFALGRGVIVIDPFAGLVAADAEPASDFLALLGIGEGLVEGGIFEGVAVPESLRFGKFESRGHLPPGFELGFRRAFAGLDIDQLGFQRGLVVDFGDRQHLDFFDESLVVGVEGGEAVDEIADDLMGGDCACKKTPRCRLGPGAGRLILIGLLT